MADRTVRVRLEAAVQGFAAAMARASTNVRSFGTSANRSLGRVKGTLGSLGPAAGLAGLGVAAGLKSAIDSAAEFEQSAMKLQTQIGLTSSEARDMAEAAKEVGTATGVGAQEAIDAAFFINSAGLRGAEGMDALERSAQAARIGLGETRDIADLVTSAMNAYGSENVDAALATDILATAVREGKAEASEMAASMGQVLPIASEMGVAFEEVAGVQAAMTRTGTNAGTAAIQLRQVLMGLINPTNQAREALGDVGLSAQGLRDQIREEGLFETLMTLKGAFEGNEEGMSRVFENARSLMGVLDLMGANVEDNAAIMDAMSEASGTLDGAIGKVADTTADKTARMKANFEDLKLNVADRLIPAVNWAIEDLNRGMERGFGGSLADFLTGRHLSEGLGIDDFWQDLFGTEDVRDPGQGIDWSAWFTGDPFASEAETIVGALGRAREATAEYGDHMGRMPKTFADYKGGQEEAAESTWDAAEAAERARQNLAEYRAELRAMTDPVFALNKALSDATEAEEALQEVTQEHGSDSQEAQEALWDFAESITGVEQAALDGDLSFEAFDGRLQRWVDQGRITQEQADRLRERVDELVESVDAVEGERTAKLRADIGEATGAVDAFIDHLTANGFSRSDAASAARWTARANFHISTSGLTPGQLADAARYEAQVPGRAHGGPVRAGTPYVVGEDRPELFVPDTSGMVLPSVPAAMSGPASGGGSTTVTLPVYLDGREIGRSAAVIDSLSGEVSSRQLQTAGAGW